MLTADRPSVSRRKEKPRAQPEAPGRARRSHSPRVGSYLEEKHAGVEAIDSRKPGSPGVADHDLSGFGADRFNGDGCRRQRGKSSRLHREPGEKIQVAGGVTIDGSFAGGGSVGLGNKIFRRGSADGDRSNRRRPGIRPGR